MKNIAVIGVGNMAKAIISGIVSADFDVESMILFDANPAQYQKLPKSSFTYICADSITDAVSCADVVLLAVKPQNYPEVLEEISRVRDCNQKLYISIGAGISVSQVSDALDGARTVRVLPNVPMLIGKGVSVICRNEQVAPADFETVCDIFKSSGSIVLIEESEMNRMIGVTSSSPAYVFRFIRAMYEGALAQGLSAEPELLHAICDMVIGSAEMLKNASDTPDELISKVASKGGTTEQALKKLDECDFDQSLIQAMQACTKRAEELGKNR